MRSIRTLGRVVALVLAVTVGPGCAALTYREATSAPPAPEMSPVPSRPPGADPTATETATVATTVPASTPTPTATATFVPTVDTVAVTSTITAGEAQIGAKGTQLLCLRMDDLDADGEAEWVGVYVRPGEAVRPGAFVLDAETWHELSPFADAKHGLGEHPTCQIDVRDVNVDGRIEILVWGHAGASIELLHVFAWDGLSYALVAAFEGNAGIRLEESDGEMGEEVVVGHRADADLVWEVVYTWDGSAYGWTWDRHAWFYADRPHVYDTRSPERAVISFYLALDDRDLPGAYGLLSGSAQSTRPFDAWAGGFVTTLGVEASAVGEIGRDASETASVSAQVMARDNVDGRVYATLWDVEWRVVAEGDGWRLDSATVVELSRRELTYVH